MINNFGLKSRKDDVRYLCMVILVFLFLAWLCTPPGNKFMQICFWGNNTQFMIAKLTNKDDTTAHLFYRNNAIYLAKMYPNNKAAVTEMNKAIAAYPTYMPDSGLNDLYKDRANIKLYNGDYKSALDDFLHSGPLGLNDYLKVALLFKQQGLYKQAASYCNEILAIDNTAYAGYACLADFYETTGRPDISIRIWDLALDRKQTARAYADRAVVKKKIGDFEGYKADADKAKELVPMIDFDQSFINETLHPKMLTLNIIRI